MARFWKRLRLTLDMIKFEHSVFALPFALTGALLAWRDSGFAIQGLGWRFLWIVVAMVAARSAAMAFNRILDADIDARNKRTANRLSELRASGRVLESRAIVPEEELDGEFIPCRGVDLTDEPQPVPDRGQDDLRIRAGVLGFANRPQRNVL